MVLRASDFNMYHSVGGSKLPNLVVASAKGTSRTEKGGVQETADKGEKRARDSKEKSQVIIEDRLEKKRRQESPEDRKRV